MEYGTKYEGQLSGHCEKCGGRLHHIVVLGHAEYDSCKKCGRVTNRKALRNPDKAYYRGLLTRLRDSHRLSVVAREPEDARAIASIMDSIMEQARRDDEVDTGDLMELERWHRLWRGPRNPERNPVERRGDYFYAALPYRFALTRGAVYWLGPYKDLLQAQTVAGFARGPSAEVLPGRRGYYVRLSGGLRFKGRAELGGFESAREAAATLGHLLPSNRLPDLAENEQSPEHGRRAAQKPQRGESVPETDDSTPDAAKHGAPPAEPAQRVPRTGVLPMAATSVIDVLAHLGWGRKEARTAMEQAVESIGADKADVDYMRFANTKYVQQNPADTAECPDCQQTVAVPTAAEIVDCGWCGARSAVVR